MRSGDERRCGRRCVLAGGLAGVSWASAGCASMQGLLGGTRYESVRVEVDADGVVWSGMVTFQSRTGTRVEIEIDRALGSRSYVLPDDIDGNDYDVITEPIRVLVTPERGVTDAEPLVVAVHCDGSQNGRASSATVDDPARVEIG